MMNNIKSKNNIYTLMVIVTFIFALKFFESTPFESIFFQLQAVYLAFILLFLIAFVVLMTVNNLAINKVSFYYLILIITIPIYSAYRSHAEFGQPFLYGVLTERGWLLFGTGIWFYYILMTKKVTFATMEASFVFMAWASFIIFSLFILTFDPSQLQNSDEASKFVQMTSSRGLRFKFQNFFISFGAIYYFIKYSMKKNPVDLIFLSLFLIYVLFVIQGRGYMLTLAATFFLYYWLNYSLPKFLLTMLKLVLFVSFALLIIQIIMPEYITQMGNLYSQMFQVLAGGESEDSSANARIFESLIVFDYFNAHNLSIWLGTGKISQQWNDGYESIFGYFYPSDIGILGGVFVYGISGFIALIIIPFIMVIKVLRVSVCKNDIFPLSLKYVLIFVLIGSIQGSFYFDYVTYVIPLFILIAYNKLFKRAVGEDG
ncbi:hypothetical protein [Sulfuricurvum sp.]|uniref:hypothetical protein n=1 Tax=Sulfuricurvum sp. TaxID=2025608 RepID=UPI0026129142|nr:hypothetical protein [Sulfuricurvum sp.]MDD4950729.1 hypothetical protein [Sulfuricurvum sp.]